MKATHKTLTAAVFLAAAGIGLNAQAGSIENMERERAIMLQTMLDPNMSQEERHSKAKLSQKRLIDLERIVLRDKSLDGRNTPLVKRVFADYDSSFLVHAVRAAGSLDQLPSRRFPASALIDADGRKDTRRRFSGP
ncbi:MAG: hypothetical protein VW835_04230 [Rickettsiales bacterium]